MAKHWSDPDGEGFMAGWRGFWGIAGEFAGFTAGAAVVLASILAFILLVMSQCSTPVEAQRAEAGMSCTGTATERTFALKTTYDLKVTCR